MSGYIRATWKKKQQPKKQPKKQTKKQNNIQQIKSFFSFRLIKYYTLCYCFLNQVGVYMGKRDFVDHVDSVDPVGMWENRPNFINLPVISSTYQVLLKLHLCLLFYIIVFFFFHQMVFFSLTLNSWRGKKVNKFTQSLQTEQIINQIHLITYMYNKSPLFIYKVLLNIQFVSLYSIK